MDGTLFIAMAMVLVIIMAVLAFVLVARQQAKKENQKITQQLKNIAERHNLEIGHKEKLRSRIIAMDKNRTTLLYFDSKIDLHHLLSLAEITGVTVEKKGKNISTKVNSGKSSAEEHIDSIELAIRMQNKETISLPFYIEIYDGILEMLPLKAKAEKWKELIIAV